MALAMWSSLRKAFSNALEGALRWLTASVLRSTAIFVFLTFVPILLLTYYIVATSIQNSRAGVESADRQVSAFAASLLRADLRGERDALAGAADLGQLQRALTTSQALSPALLGAIQGKPRQPGPEQVRQLATDRAAAATSLTRLWRRRHEFLTLALYDSQGMLQASVPAAAPAPATLAATDGLPAWFERSLAGQETVSTVLPPAGALPRRLAFAVPVGYPLPESAHAPRGARGTGVLVGLLPTTVVQAWVRGIALGSEHYLYLLDARGQPVSAPANGPLSAADVAALPATGYALGGRSGSGEYVTAIHLATLDINYAPLASERMAMLLVRPMRIGFYVYRVFYDKLALIAVIIFLLAVATGLLLRAAFRYYQRYNREVESGRSKTEALLGSIGDGVFAVDGAGRIIEFNRAAEELTGVPAAEALGRPYAAVIELVEDRPGAVIPPARPDPVRQAMLEGRTFRFLRDLVLLRRDGARLPVTVSAAPVRDERGAVAACIVVFSDASQEREVDRMKNEFISIASHQLRTPMSGVKGVLALLQEEVLGPLNPEQRKYLARAYESNERLIALVNDLLNISRLEQGSLQVRAEPVNLDEVLHALVAEFQPRAARYQQRLELAPPAAAADAIVIGDPVRLREVFTNLLDNAVKYTPEKGAITVRLAADPLQVRVEIADTGVGIPADKLPGLFQKFSRIQNPLSGREFGTGLGLYFARSVIELHQGRIEVDSRPGQGTTFRVILPRRRAAVAAPESLVTPTTLP